MRKLIGIILLSSMFTMSYQFASADFDSSKPLLCAVIETIECDAGKGCSETTVEIMNIPQFIWIDMEKSKISGKVEGGKQEDTVIKNFEQVDGKLIMQGGEGGRGWSMVIQESTGKLSATISGDQAGFVIFGACTTL
jgi:hypothetical protein